MSKPRTGEEPRVTIAPMLSVRSGRRAIEFYKEAFGAKELYRVDDQRNHRSTSWEGGRAKRRPRSFVYKPLPPARLRARECAQYTGLKPR